MIHSNNFQTSKFKFIKYFLKTIRRYNSNLVKCLLIEMGLGCHLVCAF